ncbi:S1 family peptidase [Sorangium sp. So ce1097]|uniref:S1 family peptidase n=1 Tax=Sorangium sp. So ce1097 TaxID=3133330 RepID=UPI003F627E05
MRKTILFFTAAILSACTAEVDDLRPSETDANSAGIIGGTVDHGDPAVVQILGNRPNKPESVETCTATLIAPKVLLTAAHCVVTWIYFDYEVQAFLGTDRWVEDGPYVSVKEVHMHPQYDYRDTTLGYDIAVAILDEPLGIEPVPYNRTPLTQAAVGQPVRLIGYGEDESGWGNVKKHVSTTVHTVEPMRLGFGDAAHHTCKGDSGGPALMDVNGVPTLVGVTSYGDAVDGQVCTSGWHTPVDRYVAFVDPFVNAP